MIPYNYSLWRNKAKKGKNINFGYSRKYLCIPHYLIAQETE